MTNIPVSQEMAASYRYIHNFGKEALGLVLDDFEAYAEAVIAVWTEVELTVGERVSRAIYDAMTKHGMTFSMPAFLAEKNFRAEEP